MKNYNSLLKKIMDTGSDRKGRNGVTRGVFTEALRFKMQDGFPATTTKKLAFRSVAAELFWFMSGSNDNKILQRMGCEIWTANANADYWKSKAKFDGDLGRVYGVQWRHWKRQDGTTVDQLSSVIEKIKKDPNDRRLIVTAWNHEDIDEMAKAGLPPCHCLFQFFVGNGKLSCQLYQRSCDTFLGVPFNIASYALLTLMMAHVTGLKPGEFIWTGGDTHLYVNHLNQVNEQLSREPRKAPAVKIVREVKELWDFKVEDFELIGYDPHPSIKAPIAV